MARSEHDLFTLQLSLVGQVSMDWERIETDPVFRTILATYEEPDEVEERQAMRVQALREYLQHYIIRERFLRDVPSTNGPGTLFIDSIKES